MFSLNVRGTHLCMGAAARAMIAQRRGGRIITASSIAGYRGEQYKSLDTRPNRTEFRFWECTGAALFSAYSASKFAIKGLTQSLGESSTFIHGVLTTCNSALEVGKHGITVNSYAPGSIDTPLCEIMFLGGVVTINIPSQCMKQLLNTLS